MRKIVIVGSAGSGKSTLSKLISKKLNIDVYHLDAIHWKPGWIMSSYDEKVEVQNEIVKKDSWIIDGNYNSTLSIRFESADTIIFLDINRYICIYRVLYRFIKYRNSHREDMVKGNKEKIDLEFIKWIWKFPKNNKLRMMEMLSEYKNKKIIVLRNNKEVTRFLNYINDI